MLKFDVLNWFSGRVQFTAEIDCTADAPQSVKLGLAVHWAVKSGARLDGASLDGASLVRARLDGARLDGARLDGARLDGASLVRARLDGASLDGAKLPHFNIPQEGELIVWKKLREACIAKLLIPADARRTATPIGRKCRAEFVKVLAIFGPKDGARTEGRATHDGTHYVVGEIVRPDSFDPDIRVECTHGIHFFQTREEANDYN